RHRGEGQGQDDATRGDHRLSSRKAHRSWPPPNRAGMPQTDHVGVSQIQTAPSCVAAGQGVTMRVQFLAVVGSLLFAFPVLAKDPKFTPIPAEQTGGKSSGLELRIVRYDGSVNGVLEVEVKNPRPEPVEFSAKGLYFVPAGNADQAPQRLGAVGPFNLQTEQGWQHRETTTVAPG